MSDTTRKDSRSRIERLLDHTRSCAECDVSDDMPLDAIARALDVEPPLVTHASLSQGVMVAAAPMLAAYAKRAYRTRLARSLLLTLTPLPIVAIFDVYMLREAYHVLSGWLPAPVVAWMLVGYATMLLLLCALTYAALPLLIAQPRLEAKGITS